MASEPRTGETAAARIAIHTARLTSLKDEDLLGAIRGTEPFPEAEIIDSAWDDPALWDRLGLMLAFADEIGRRGLIDGIAPLYDLAPLDDPWEMTQGIRHGPERATKDQPGVLESIMRELVGHPGGGTRLWATRELGILRDAESLGVLRSTALEDPEPLVREEAVGSLLLLTQARGRLKRGITSSPRTTATKAFVVPQSMPWETSMRRWRLPCVRHRPSGSWTRVGPDKHRAPRPIKRSAGLFGR